MKDINVNVVWRTFDYSKFKLMELNRDVNLFHVEQLKKSFEKEYLQSPIIVNENFEVVDGQHRLHAAKDLNLPIYYCVVDGYTADHVRLLNMNQKNWSKMDYLNLYCKKGLPEYLRLKELMDQYPELKLNALLKLGALKSGTVTLKHLQINGTRSTVQSNVFESGNFEFVNYALTIKLIKDIYMYAPYFKNFSDIKFVEVMITLLQTDIYNHKEMIKRLESGSVQLKRQPTIIAYREHLEDVWNYRRVNKVSFRYL